MKSANAGGASDAYTYDALNRPASATDASGATTYAYDNVGNLQSLAYPNGVATNYAYDTLNRLKQVGAQAQSAQLSSYAYTLGAAGNRLTVAELSGRTVNYGYDALYRLTSETVASDPAGHNFTDGYVYDNVGNRQQLVVNGVTANAYTYDADDRLGSDQYDANGNTTLSLGTANTYDFENRMLTHGNVSIVYDGDGNRVAETVGGVTTQYLVDTQNLTGYAQVVDELQNGAVTRTYSYGLERISETQPINSTLTTSFYLYDGHGSVRQLLSTRGVVTDTYTYDAFGNLISSTGTTPNNYLFAGEQFDPALGVYYNRARYLNTTTGRFWSMDTDEGDDEAPLSLHKYLYAQADPADGLDPSGYSLASILYGQQVHDDIGAAFLRWTQGPPPHGLYDATIKQILGRSVPGFSRFRPDLVDTATGEVYEIKPIDAEVLGYQQLAGYLIILNLSDPMHRAWVPGEDFQAPALPDLIQLGPHTIALVYPPFLGLITYQVLDSYELTAYAGFSIAAAVKLSNTAAEAELGTEVGTAGLTAELGVP